MTTQCLSLDDALEAFGEATLEASGVPINQKQKILYKVINNVRANLNPESFKDFIAEVDSYMEWDPDLKQALVGYKNAFNPEFNFERWLNRMTELEGEEIDESKLDRRERRKKEFLSQKFKDPNAKTTAGRAMLYFQREAQLKLMQTFMVDRDHGYLVSDQDLSQNVKLVKQELLDTVVDYLKSQGFRDEQLGDTQLYSETGEFQDILEEGSPLAAAIKQKLQLGESFSTNKIKEAYENFRTEKVGWEQDKAFIDAYNAKVLLEDFDRVATMLLGSIVKPGNAQYNQLSNEKYETKISRATNMWGNGIGDEVENIADLVSDVTQLLIQTSKKYSWKGGPMKDQYLSFSDFNYIMTKVKKFSQHTQSKNIVLNDAFFDQDANKGAVISEETKRSLATLEKMKKEQGLTQTAPTFEDLLSFISDNPQRHLHAIFDLLCNTNLLNYFPGDINANDKNLIWSVGKELFGTWADSVDENGETVHSRSLYDLHKKSNGDRIFEIVTQIADSMFADQFLQYYEDQEGTLKMRFLQDFAVSQLKNQILYDMKQTHGMYDPDKFQRFIRDHKIVITNKPATVIQPGAKKDSIWKVKNPDHIPGTGTTPLKYVRAEFLDSIEIPIGDNFKIKFQNGKLESFDKNGSIPKEYRGRKLQYMESVWKSKEFRDLIKDAIGFDFDTNVELTSAYEEAFKQIDADGTSYINYSELVNDISRLCASAIYNQTFNNVIVPTILGQSEKVRNRRNVEILRDIQFQGQKIPKINSETGSVEMVADVNKEAYLAKIGLATATIRGLLTSAQVKTGEGTALASECLSCLRASHAYQILTQNRRKDSASNHMTYVNNENGFFEGVVGVREFKSDATVKVNTDMSAAESFHAAFLGGFVGAFVDEQDSSTINRNGRAYIIPAVYSDKTKQDVLAVNLQAESRHQPGKTYQTMSDSEIEFEIRQEMGEMYDKIITNINIENSRFAEWLGINSVQLEVQARQKCLDLGMSQKNAQMCAKLILNRDLLAEISNKLCDAEDLLNIIESTGKGEIVDHIKALEEQKLPAEEIVKQLSTNENFQKILGKARKGRIISQMNDMLITHNRTRRRNPIELCEHVHYLFDDNGQLVPNNTLTALWGRFKGTAKLNELLGITDLYPDGHKEASTIEGFFHEKDIRTAYELLDDGVELYLLGTRSKEKQAEIKFLREQFPDWHTDSYKMAFAKIFQQDTQYNVGDTFTSPRGSVATILQVSKTNTGVKYLCQSVNTAGEVALNWLSEEAVYNDSIKPGVTYNPIPVEQRPGTWIPTQDKELLKRYMESPDTRKLVQIHPMISKLNRLSYLASQQYTSAVGGAHYVYKGGGKNVLIEEAKRWLASNKRNVCYASTVHKYQNKTLNGVPKWYQIAPIEDISSAIYSIMGDLDSHKPIDGGMFVNPWFSPLENNSLGGEAAGLDKKQFGTYYYEKYAAGGIIKTAGFALTNQRLRNSIPYRNLCANMTDRIWIKEFGDAQGNDIEEVLDITRDYRGRILNWVQDDAGQGTYYQRETGKGCGRFKLARIDAIYTNGSEERVFEGEIPDGWRPTNRYKIYEYPVTATGQIDTSHPEIAKQLPDPNDTSLEAQQLRLEDLEPIQKLDGADENGEFLINTNWALYNQVFGGAWSLSLDHSGRLQPSENSIYQMVHALNNIGYTRTTGNNDERFGSAKYDVDFIDDVQDQDDLWQPLKYSDISYAPNIGALKSTQMNVNPKEGMYEKMFLNAMNIQMAQLGIQLDKEHHADESEVSMPTQIIQACANKGYTIYYGDKLYNALSTLTEIAIQDCMDGIMEYMPGNENKGTLLTEVANIIVDKLIHSQDDNSAVEAAMVHLVEKARAGQKLEAADVMGQVPWSDPNIYNKIYNDLASHLTNSAIKMKFPGTLAVICPTEKMEQMYGDRRLHAYSDPDGEYQDENGEIIRGISEKTGLELEQLSIRDGEQEDKLIFDEDAHRGATIQDRLNLASKIDTQHHYWIEWRDAQGQVLTDSKGNVFRESITIDVPSKYFQLKSWLGYGGEANEYVMIDGQKVSRKGMQVARVYENITEGRELGAYNVRFESIELSDSGRRQQFNIFDLDSVRALFDYNEYKEDFDTAKKLLQDKKFIEPQRGRALKLILELMQRQSPESAVALEQEIKQYPTVDMTEVVKLSKDKKLIKDFTKAAMKVCKVLTYKAMEKDLFKISKDFNGERQLYVNGELITVNPDTIKTKAYELIMPKVYQSRFGLEENDQVAEILQDPEFFTKRALNRVKEQYVADSCFHYELKAFNGKHIYIFDSRLGDLDPDIFKPSKKAGDPVEVESGVWERQDVDGNFIHGLSSGNDKIMQVGDLGYEVIVTDNPEYYLENMSYNIATFSNETVSEENLQALASNLKGTKSRNAKKFLKAIANNQGKIRNFRNLKQRNSEINSLSLDPKVNELKEITDLREQFEKEGAELFASFNKSLDIIAGRIPAQSQQSFMPQRVVAFDNNDINTAYVSTFQLFLQGSDLDIDAVTLLGSEFDDNGKYVMWSNLADISSVENLEASQQLPFPTGRESELEINNNKDSFFTTYDDYIYELFERETDFEYDENGIQYKYYVRGDDGFYKLTLKDLDADGIKLLAQFIEEVNAQGFSIKGDLKSDDSWKPSDQMVEEWENRHQITDTLYQERTNALKELGFTSPEAAYSALQQIKAIIDSHNTYINTADQKTREKMTKNQCQWAMYQICSTPSNLVELMVGVDVSTAPIKDKKTGAVAQSPYNGDDNHAAPGNHNTIHRSFQEGQIGKQCVGIGAVSIKVNSTCQYYADKVLKEGTEEEKERLLLPRVDEWGRRVQRGQRGYLIGGKRRLGLSNLYDKSSETAEEQEVEVNGQTKYMRTMQQNLEILELLDSIQTEDDITPNVAMSLAAMLSVAVDNAKDLALAKINAGPKMFGFYAYGISLGMDIRDLAKIINTPQGRAISKICEGNALNGQMGATDAIKAIEKLEGNGIFRDLVQFDITGRQAVTDNFGNVEERPSGVLVTTVEETPSGKLITSKTSLKTASEVVEALITDYYIKNIQNNKKMVNELTYKPNVRKNGKINFSKNLPNMVYQIAILGKIDDCIATITNPLLSQGWLDLQDGDTGIQGLSNSEEWLASVHQLLEYCSKYGNLVDTYYKKGPEKGQYLARDLKILAEGAKEMQILGRILSSNKGVKSRTEEGTTFIKQIENAIIDRKEIMGLNPTEEDQLDFVLFATDANYREEAIRKYEEVKHTTNILDVVSKAPHFLSYIRTCSIPYAAFKAGSAKFRARTKYYDAVVNDLKLIKSADKENAIRGIESAVNFTMLQNWLHDEGMHFILPAGSKKFVGRTQEMVTTTKEEAIPLWDPQGNGLATFKYYMEQVIIPGLKSNVDYSHNQFVQGLTSFELTKTGTHAAISASTLEGNMMPNTESQEVQVETYQADFEAMHSFDFPLSKGQVVNTPQSYADAFYIYSQYVFGGRKGPRSLMAMFNNNDCALAEDFKAYEAQVDLEEDFDFTLEELRNWCAPNSNPYNPSAEFFYGTSQGEFGKQLYQRPSKRKGKKSNPDDQENQDEKSATTGPTKVLESATPIAVQNYVNPVRLQSAMGENIYILGKNSRVVDNPDLTNLGLDPANPYETFNIVANEFSGEYQVIANGPLSERSQKILDKVGKNLEGAYRIVRNPETGAWERGISTDAVKSYIEEASHEIDQDC